MKPIANIFILFTLVLIQQVVQAQDLLVKTDSSKYQVTITEINPFDINYKLYNYKEGPLVVVSKTEVAYILYKNGVVENFTSTNKEAFLEQHYKKEAYERSRKFYLTPEEKDKRAEPLYKYQNYIGLNFITVLNNCIGLNYIRDVKQANLMIMIPFAVGIGKPQVTNGMYRSEINGPFSNFSYNNIKYQIGLSPLFTPNMKRGANFLVGPSINYTAYDVSTELNYNYYNTATGMSETKTFKNNFELRRKHYGITVGFNSRISERINMNMLVTLGYKEDAYSETDPFGINYINSLNNNPTVYTYHKNNNTYVSFMWSAGYRF